MQRRDAVKSGAETSDDTAAVRIRPAAGFPCSQSVTGVAARVACLHRRFNAGPRTPSRRTVQEGFT